MASPISAWDDAYHLGLQLSVKDRLRLVERLIESVETELPATPSPERETWGQQLVRLVAALGPIEMAHPEITDPVEWVRQIRKDQAEHRNLDWDTSDVRVRTSNATNNQ